MKVSVKNLKGEVGAMFAVGSVLRSEPACHHRTGRRRKLEEGGKQRKLSGI